MPQSNGQALSHGWNRSWDPFKVIVRATQPVVLAGLGRRRPMVWSICWIFGLVAGLPSLCRAGEGELGVYRPMFGMHPTRSEVASERSKADLKQRKIVVKAPYEPTPLVGLASTRSARSAVVRSPGDSRPAVAHETEAPRVPPGIQVAERSMPTLSERLATYNANPKFKPISHARSVPPGQQSASAIRGPSQYLEQSIPPIPSQTDAIPHGAYDAVQLGSLSIDNCPTLDGRQIGCRSAQEWIPSDVLRSRARTLIQAYCDEDKRARCAAQILANFLYMQASHQEDIGAATAMRAYYTRIAIAEQQMLTEESLRLIDSEAQKQGAIREGGLSAGTDLSSFDRLRLEIRDQQLLIQSQDRQLRCLLAQLTGYDYDIACARMEILEVFESSLDCERLKQRALANRKDLKSWQYLACHVNEDTAPMFARMLPTIVGGFGLPLPTICGLKMLLCPPDYSCLVANMRHEIDLTVETHRRWICQAVEEKCAQLTVAYQRIGLAQRTVESWHRRIEQLEELDRKGESQPAELALARSEILKAMSAEIDRRMDARIAEIDLAEACGRLSDRCCEGSPWMVTGFE